MSTHLVDDTFSLEGRDGEYSARLISFDYEQYIPDDGTPIKKGEIEISEIKWVALEPCPYYGVTAGCDIIERLELIVKTNNAHYSKIEVSKQLADDTCSELERVEEACREILRGER